MVSMSKQEPSTPAISFAFQPILHVNSGTVISFEALVRGSSNESAAQVFDQVDYEQRYAFDELLRLKAIPLAAELGIGCNLNLNLLPGSLELSDRAIVSTLAMAEQCGLRPEQITLEITEGEIISDYARFAHTINLHRGVGLKFAIDDFGSGYSGLNLLAEFQPDSIKLDMALIRNIDTRGPRQAIVRGIIRTCTDLGIDIVAEGVENLREYQWCHDEGLEIYQGFLFAKPGFEHLPPAFYPRLDGHH